MPNRFARTILTAAVVSLPALAAAAEPSTRYYLILDAAAFSGKNPANTRELVLDLERQGEVWGPVFGISRNYNMATHRGAVQSARRSEGKLELDLMVDYTPDKWIPEAQGRYKIRLGVDDGVLTGTFEGTFNEVDVRGKAWGWALANTPTVEDFQPLAPQEHPRILFRKSDLPALRKKLQTPLGKAAREKMPNSLIGLGVLYQLTGEKEWADKAQAEAKRVLKGKSYGWYGTAAFTPKRPLGGRMEQLAVAYDLCYDAWDEDFKARIRSWLMDMYYSVFFAPESLGSTNWNVQSNHVGIVYTGLAMAGLAFFDEPSEEPVAPSAPYTRLDLPAMRDFKPANGVPVVKLTPGKSPTDWLLTEPLLQVTPYDPRVQFYGLQTVHPKPGTKVQIGDFELTFQRIEQKRKSVKDWGGIYIGDWLQSGKRSKTPLTLAFYTVIDVDEPGLYKVINPVSRGNLAQVAIAGKLLANQQVVRLDKGLYPMMALIQYRIKWDETAPHLAKATEKDLEASKELAGELDRKYQARLLNYKAAHQLWKQYGGADPAYQKLLRLSRWYMFLQARYAVGTGGFQAEVAHYNYDTTDGLCRYAPAFRRMFGYDLSPFDDITHYVPRKIVAGPQDINGTTKIGYAYFASLYPIVPEKWKPDVLAAWRKDAGIASDESIDGLLQRDGVQAFVNYPLQGETAPVGTHLPQTWYAPDSGLIAGRSGWDRQACVAQFFAKSMPIHGWNGPNAGTFRLRGLGQNWAVGPTARDRRRFQENVVWLPENEVNESGLGEITHYENRPDGSFVASIDLDEVYGPAGKYVYSKYGRVRLPKDLKVEQTGITGMRSIAVDYSGRSGSPCLLVVVDRIDGGDKGLWLWQTPEEPEKCVTARDNGFTVTGQGKATLRGQFITPGKVSITAKSRTAVFTKAAGHGAGEKTFKVPINAVSVEGPDNKKHFFFVATLSPDGRHREIQVKGSGLDAVVQVGKQTIRFDGQKIILGGR